MKPATIHDVGSDARRTGRLRAGSVLLGLRKRTRGYDGSGLRRDLPGVQLAFRVAPDEVEACYERLVEMGVEILEPPTDQPRGHRTVYFADPEGNMLEGNMLEGNMLEVYAEI